MTLYWHGVIPDKNPVDLAREGLLYDGEGNCVLAMPGTRAHQPALERYAEAQWEAEAWGEDDQAATHQVDVAEL